MLTYFPTGQVQERLGGSFVSQFLKSFFDGFRIVRRIRQRSQVLALVFRVAENYSEALSGCHSFSGKTGEKPAGNVIMTAIYLLCQPRLLARTVTSEGDPLVCRGRARSVRCHLRELIARVRNLTRWVSVIANICCLLPAYIFLRDVANSHIFALIIDVDEAGINGLASGLALRFTQLYTLLFAASNFIVPRSTQPKMTSGMS